MDKPFMLLNIFDVAHMYNPYFKLVPSFVVTGHRSQVRQVCILLFPFLILSRLRPRSLGPTLARLLQ